MVSYTCECGRVIDIKSKGRHLKSKIHQKNMDIKNGTYVEPEVKVCKSILEKNDRITCACGVSHLRKHKARHLKSKQCQKWHTLQQKQGEIKCPASKAMLEKLDFIKRHKNEENGKVLYKKCNDLLNDIIEKGIDSIDDETFMEFDGLYYDFYSIHC